MENKFSKAEMRPLPQRRKTEGGLEIDAEGYNLSFGLLLKAPVVIPCKTNWHGTIELCLWNDVETYHREQAHEAYHSSANRLALDYNSRQSGSTAWITVKYSDYDPKILSEYLITNGLNHLVRRILCLHLTLFQRRRILANSFCASSGSSKMVWSLTPPDGDAIVDSIAWGLPSVSTSDLTAALVSAIQAFHDHPNTSDLRAMCLIRYNEAMNSVYIGERSEAYWRILESLGEHFPRHANVDSQHDVVVKLLKNPTTKRLKTLQFFLNSMLTANCKYNDSIVAQAFDYRNLVMHEYLSPNGRMSGNDCGVYDFLRNSAERCILHLLNVPTDFHKPIRSNTRQGFVVNEMYI